MEETGLQVQLFGETTYTVCILDAMDNEASRVDVMEIKEWEGSIQSQDPDQLILDVRFIPVQEAIGLLELLPWRSMREPIVAYLKRENLPGRAWIYRRSANGQEELLNHPGA